MDEIWKISGVYTWQPVAKIEVALESPTEAQRQLCERVGVVPVQPHPVRRSASPSARPVAAAAPWRTLGAALRASLQDGRQAPRAPCAAHEPSEATADPHGRLQSWAPHAAADLLRHAPWPQGRLSAAGAAPSRADGVALGACHPSGPARTARLSDHAPLKREIRRRARRGAGGGFHHRLRSEKEPERSACIRVRRRMAPVSGSATSSGFPKRCRPVGLSPPAADGQLLSTAIRARKTQKRPRVSACFRGPTLSAFIRVRPRMALLSAAASTPRA